ncbi:hypothetical protein GIB67_031999 [Kingdonia uniflora]|uniref:Uncharacterized protein n=1 Tax=Kingdonia uniflora TaxID=39325 RepID=A0A7J7MX02_9MAGN|nr:hypothetical protein GIB67_031999 [Kingdonia uniflora]
MSRRRMLVLIKPFNLYPPKRTDGSISGVRNPKVIVADQTTEGSVLTLHEAKGSFRYKKCLCLLPPQSKLKLSPPISLQHHSISISLSLLGNFPTSYPLFLSIFNLSF